MPSCSAQPPEAFIASRSLACCPLSLPLRPPTPFPQWSIYPSVDPLCGADEQGVRLLIGAAYREAAARGLHAEPKFGFFHRPSSTIRVMMQLRAAKPPTPTEVENRRIVPAVSRRMHAVERGLRISSNARGAVCCVMFHSPPRSPHGTANAAQVAIRRALRHMRRGVESSGCAAWGRGQHAQMRTQRRHVQRRRAHVGGAYARRRLSGRDETRGAGARVGGHRRAARSHAKRGGGRSGRSNPFLPPRRATAGVECKAARAAASFRSHTAATRRLL
eukprot:6195302-Pleurochrysis_carterae.AAC.2